MKRKLLLLLLLFLSVRCITAQTSGLDDSIAGYFQELRNNMKQYQDLWNLDLYGPVLLVDPATRRIYSNFPDSAGILKRDGDIFTGLLPKMINIANTSLTWQGMSWAMIMLPFPQNKQERLDLLSHELFHRSQPALGFRASNPDNDHLDKREGRIYLRLELEALGLALKSSNNDEMREHLANAMFFRNTRYSLFPGAASNENRLEINEGLATYTGIMMSGRNDRENQEYFEKKLIEFRKYPTFVRSFAYITTPIYGFILNRSDKVWNKQVTDTTNLTDYFIKAFSVSVPPILCPDCLARYRYKEILDEETSREEEKVKQIAELKTLFIEKPHLDIPLEKMNISFDPRNIIPLEDYGNVYPVMRITDNWGILTVTGRALLSKNWDKVTVSEPAVMSSSKITGEGWTLELNENYKVEKNVPGGNYAVTKK
jgi:hypothetical protein